MYMVIRGQPMIDSGEAGPWKKNLYDRHIRFRSPLERGGCGRKPNTEKGPKRRGAMEATSSRGVARQRGHCSNGEMARIGAGASAHREDWTSRIDNANAKLLLE
jgi:hypothetical protein